MNSIAPASRPSVAIIGGGFSGAAFALHLLRDAPDLRVHLTMIEPGATLGAGLAYSTPDPEHRINVAAARMAVFAEDPAQFDRWFRAGGGPAQDPQSVGWAL